MDAISKMKSITSKNTNLEKIRRSLKKYTGIYMTDKAIIYLNTKWQKELNDLDNNEDALGYILVDYDEYAMANITESQKSRQFDMERFATESISSVEGQTRYYKQEDVYFEWNEEHRKEHPERENKIEEVANNILHNVKSIRVDTRKPYGEVRYILKCTDSNNSQIIIMCHRYDKTHIRIITAWRDI